MTQDYSKKPIDELLVEAKNGSMEAQNALAMLHELGLLPEASLQEAARLYAKSAKAGDPLAALFLGVMYDKGGAGLPADKALSTSYFQTAAKGGFRCVEDRLDEAGIGRRTVLLVDDSANIRTQTRALLDKSGYDVVEAADAAQAIRFLQSGGRVDLVLSAVEMPNMDGLEMVAIIRGRLQRKDLPVVMVSAVRDVNILKKAKTLGVQGWVLKPVNNDQLVQSVKKAMAA